MNPEWLLAEHASNAAFDAIQASFGRFLYDHWPVAVERCPEFERFIASFVQTRTRNHDALRRLNVACDALLDSGGQRGLLNNANLEFWEGASTAFGEHIISWQPLMDATSSLVNACLKTHDGSEARGLALPALIKRAHERQWPGAFEEVRVALLERLAFYHQELRPIRNSLIHNHKVVAVYPHPAGRLAVEIVTPFAEQGRATYDLLSLVVYSYIEFSEFAEASRTALSPDLSTS